jgi:hypothetical protein
MEGAGVTFRAATPEVQEETPQLVFVTEETPRLVFVTGGAEKRPAKRGGGALLDRVAPTLDLTEDVCGAGRSGGVCVAGPVRAALEKFSQKAPVVAGDSAGKTRRRRRKKAAAAVAAVAAAADALGCDTEACVVTHPEFKRFAAEEAGVSRDEVEAEAKAAFKPVGPRNSTALLTNFHIDAVLAQWATAHPGFHPYPFAMSDFEEMGHPLAGLKDIGAGGSTSCAGCVMNTDVSSGRGKHWVALFLDFRASPWTVEYFNSAGNPPPPHIAAWMERAAAKLAKKKPCEPVHVTRVRHQRGNTECGLYSLFYIYSRLTKTGWRRFEDGGDIPDDAMTEFRERVFRS